MIAIDEHPCYLRAREGATQALFRALRLPRERPACKSSSRRHFPTGAAPGAPAPAPCMRALITAPVPFSPQVLLRLPRAPAVVADADAAASSLFDEFPSLCVVVISLPGIAVVARYTADNLSTAVAEQHSGRCKTKLGSSGAESTKLGSSGAESADAAAALAVPATTRTKVTNLIVLPARKLHYTKLDDRAFHSESARMASDDLGLPRMASDIL